MGGSADTPKVRLNATGERGRALSVAFFVSEMVLGMTIVKTARPGRAGGALRPTQANPSPLCVGMLAAKEAATGGAFDLEDEDATAASWIWPIGGCFLEAPQARLSCVQYAACTHVVLSLFLSRV